MLPWLGLGLGVLVVALTASSVIATLMVPRGVSSRLSSALGAVLRALIIEPASRLPRYESRDRALALVAPAFLLLQLAAWIALLLTGFALILWPLVGNLGTAFTISGSSMFTLGYATAGGAAPTVVIVLAAISGLFVVALQIAYLPTLYAAFNRRETLVTMLESRGGAPVWGPEILARHMLVDIVDSLPRFYADWEQWAADVAESHSNYPVLAYFRSPDPLRNWVIALLAVLDAAALQHSLTPISSPSECRLVLRMGFTALRDIARTQGIRFDPDPHPDDPIALDEEDFRGAVAHIEAAGWHPERDIEEAYRHFRGWRVNYESIAWALADRLEAPPALWSGPRHHASAPVAPRRPTDRRPGADLREELRAQSQRRREARSDGTEVDARRGAGHRTR